MAMRTMASEAFLELVRARSRITGKLRGTPATVHYFHQVDDPYSYLVVQKLSAFVAAYNVSLEVHLTSAAQGDFRGDEQRYPRWALKDAYSIAPGYGVKFPDLPDYPADSQRRAANSLLSESIQRGSFFSDAQSIMAGYWASSLEARPTATADQQVFEGNRLRTRLGHYAGATFYYEGEWFWGIDRLYQLEHRLQEQGRGDGPTIVPRPEVTIPTDLDAGEVTLEYFPSLRSPYTAISYARTLDLAERTGVNFRIRPVLPMMMRGVAAPMAKGRYIMMDTAREARAYGEPFGRIVDPFGEPVLRAFSMLPWLQEGGHLQRFIEEYLQAAWAQGIDVTEDNGLQEVVERCGLDWQQARSHMDDQAAAKLLEDNVNEMLTEDLWGVPSFRVSGGNAATTFSCWGQDRLWRVASEIIVRAGQEPTMGKLAW